MRFGSVRFGSVWLVSARFSSASCLLWLTPSLFSCAPRLGGDNRLTRPCARCSIARPRSSKRRDVRTEGGRRKKLLGFLTFGRRRRRYVEPLTPTSPVDRAAEHGKVTTVEDVFCFCCSSVRFQTLRFIYGLSWSGTMPFLWILPVAVPHVLHSYDTYSLCCLLASGRD